VQSQAKEYVQFATALAENKPPKGSPDSWKTLTASYIEAATALDRAAQAKDQQAAQAAHGKLAGSCMQCHREHRAMRR
jgi:cytochrome c556